MVKNSPAKAGSAGDVSSIPGLGRSPGEGNGSPPQYSCLENPMDRGAWRATIDGDLATETMITTATKSSEFQPPILLWYFLL